MAVLSDVIEGAKAFAAESPALSAGGILVLFLVTVTYLVRTRSSRLNFPVVGVPGQRMGKKELTEGVRLYPNTPFIVPTAPPTVILPMSTLDEVKNLPEDHVSFQADVKRMFVAEVTKIGEQQPEAVKSVKLDLTKHITSTLDALQDETRYAFNGALGDAKDWVAAPVYSSMLRIVALMAGRVFVGRPLSREEEWIKSTINYTIDCVKVRDAVLKYPSWSRKYVLRWLPEFKKFDSHRIRGGQLLKPILDAQLTKIKNSKVTNEAETGFDDEQGTFISWVLMHTPEDRRNDPEALALVQMLLSFASIHTTTMAACHAIYDLVSRREYIKPLIEEIDTVIAQDGAEVDSEGLLWLKKQSFGKLKKLDSFLKESQRMSPPNQIANIRVVLAPLTISTGHTLPKGTRIAYPAHVVNMSPSTLSYSPEYNPADYKPPSEFDGFRFSKLRAMPGKDSRHQFVTTSPDSLAFGHGNHACPGRFFAAYEIKIIMIELLRNWDFRLEGDTALAGGVDKRPITFESDFQVTPNPFAKVEFKRKPKTK